MIVLINANVDRMARSDLDKMVRLESSCRQNVGIAEALSKWAILFKGNFMPGKHFFILQAC